jgi:16S rRNA (adenine1518-N6/adenine1519-N6)-dimethyltransferase
MENIHDLAHFSPSSISTILRDRSLSLKTKYGQNFLINRDIVARILKYAAVNKKDTILEIGPGLGTLTFFLAERAKILIAVEIDGGFTRYLSEKIKGHRIENIRLINKDFLRLKCNETMSICTPNKVISNFPYGIGLKAIVKIVDEYESVKTIIGTVQNEIADRISAKPGKKNYSSVSVYLGLLSKINVLERDIAPANFFPAPAVSSSIIKITKRTGKLPVDKDVFKDIIKSCFSNRRKSLVNNLLTSHLEIKKDRLRSIVLNLYTDIHIRAERLSIQDFVRLVKSLT